jgi:hypothetical protein
VVVFNCDRPGGVKLHEADTDHATPAGFATMPMPSPVVTLKVVYLSLVTAAAFP